MGDKYVPGDFYRICDRTGFKVLASQTKKEWTGNIVRKESWEARQPQDFVTGVRDDQSVPDPRPRPVDPYQGDLISAVSATTLAGSANVSIESTERMYASDSIGIMLDNGINFRTTILHVTNLTDLILLDRLPAATSAGLIFVNYSANSPPNIG